MDSIIKNSNSERKYKAKIKEWRLKKNISSSDMMIVNAKATKRTHEGKDTLFFVDDIPVQPQRLETFKKRKFVKESTPESPSAGNLTPPSLRD